MTLRIALRETHRPSPSAITWSKTRARALLDSRRVGRTRRYNKRRDPLLLPVLPGETLHLAAKRHALVCAFLYVFLSLSLAPLPFSLSLVVSLSPPPPREATPSSAASFSRSLPKEEEGACTPIQHIYISIDITTHNSVSSSPSVSVLPTYRRRLVNAV
jgi:hypothetical protein